MTTRHGDGSVWINDIVTCCVLAFTLSVLDIYEHVLAAYRSPAA